MVEEKSVIQKSIIATYPIAIFVFFAILLGMSVYVHDVYDAGPFIEDENTVVDVSQKDRQLQEVLSKKVDPVIQPIYQPKKKDDAEDIFVENAHSAIILDANSGTILYEKNSTEQRSVASITKLVTAMVVIDRVRDLDEVVIIPEGVISIEGTTVGCPTSVICDSERFFVGEKVRLRDLLHSMLIYSANDAATILAMHISGSEEDFAKLMNARMKEIGAGNTNFCRPSGLELDENEETCYSSAYDVARVMAHLSQHDKYDKLWEMMKIKEMTFWDVDKTVEHTLENTNRLVDEMPHLVGAKTGFTPRAGYCLALTATNEEGEHSVISVVLNDYQRFIDIEEMTDWAFANHEWQ